MNSLFVLYFSVYMYKQINSPVQKEGRVNYLGVGECCKVLSRDYMQVGRHLTRFTHGERDQN